MELKVSWCLNQKKYFNIFLSLFLDENDTKLDIKQFSISLTLFSSSDKISCLIRVFIFFFYFFSINTKTDFFIWFQIWELEYYSPWNFFLPSIFKKTSFRIWKIIIEIIKFSISNVSFICRRRYFKTEKSIQTTKKIICLIRAHKVACHACVGGLSVDVY